MHVHHSSRMSPGKARVFISHCSGLMGQMADMSKLCSVCAPSNRPHHYCRRGGGGLGTGGIRNGKIWHNKSVPNYATAFGSPKPFF